MDFDSIGPIFFFIVYMAISAWSKNKKRQKAEGASGATPQKAPSKAAQKVSGILEQLKQEFMEEEQEPAFFQQEIPEFDPEPVAVVQEVKPAPAPATSFMEGSQSLAEETQEAGLLEQDRSQESGQSLDEVLAPYSTIEQGILLHEILGKPRAMQSNDDWFHNS